MKEGGGKQNLLRKKYQTALHLKTARRLLRYSALPLRSMHSRFRMPHDAHARTHVPAWSHAACLTRVQWNVAESMCWC